ncbi:hypothetical protein Cni_G03714 [Canna indica]|uniref:Uncharacterized protein n=1 Tax=Canna indica TaxID=4628 RepID=A0AAQ3JU33_9LILI|nr:hypothetical protein Cni_G03714 [Canna indica]
MEGTTLKVGENNGDEEGDIARRNLRLERASRALQKPKKPLDPLGKASSGSFLWKKKADLGDNLIIFEVAVKCPHQNSLIGGKNLISSNLNSACGRIGHLANFCTPKQPENTIGSNETSHSNQASKVPVEVNMNADTKDEIFGPWQIINKKKKSQVRRYENQDNSAKNKFEVLKELKEQNSNMEEDNLAPGFKATKSLLSLVIEKEVDLGHIKAFKYRGLTERRCFNGKGSGCVSLVYKILAEIKSVCKLEKFFKANEGSNKGSLNASRFNANLYENLADPSKDSISSTNVFCDVSWFNGKVGLDFCFQNSSKVFVVIGLQCSFTPGCLSAELMAIWVSLINVELLNIKHLKIFSDCKVAFDILNGMLKPPWGAKCLVKDILNLAAELDVVS